MKLAAAAGVLALGLVGFGQVAGAAPLVTMQYVIGNDIRSVQFLGDGSVRFCDGSVLTACDGSVRPDATRVGANGGLTLVAPILLPGDGSVLPGEQDSLTLTSIDFSPNPFISGAVTFVDAGAPSNLLVTFSGLLSLGSTDFGYTLTGSATLTDAARDGVSLPAQTLLSLATPGLIAGGVDGTGVAIIGSSLSGAGPATLTPAMGDASCVACAVQVLAFGIQGSGGGDVYAMTGTFDIRETTAVPAPAPLGILATGLVLLGLVRRRA